VDHYGDESDQAGVKDYQKQLQIFAISLNPRMDSTTTAV
jgi:hypothetical protein